MPANKSENQIRVGPIKSLMMTTSVKAVRIYSSFVILPCEYVQQIR